jgi:predicted RNase H-like HicB family nuclease
VEEAKANLREAVELIFECAPEKRSRMDWLQSLAYHRWR